MSHPRIGITFCLVILALAAACASQADQPMNTRPTLDSSAATATPEILQLPEPTTKQNTQPGPLSLEATPTPEILPPAGSEIPEPGLVQGLSTNPYTITLSAGGDFALAARFYPATQSESPALILLSIQPQERAAWQLLAQTAQVKGLAALVVELPTAAGQPAVDAAIQWLKNPSNGGFQKIVTAGSQAGAGLALSGFAQAGIPQAAVLFSPTASDPLIVNGLKAAAGRTILAVQCSDATAGMQAAGQLEVIAVQCSQPGVQMLSAQPALLNRVLDWCLLQFKNK